MIVGRAGDVSHDRGPLSCVTPASRREALAKAGIVRCAFLE
jgi:hypothetical protein